MPVAMLVDNLERTAEIYDKVRGQLGAEQPAGSILHLAGPSPNGGFASSTSGSPKRTHTGSSTSASSRRSKPSRSRARPHHRRSGRCTTT